MEIMDTVTLIKEGPNARGIYDAPTETRRTLRCKVQSVGRSEFYQSASAGLRPEYILQLPSYLEYDLEKRCEFHEDEYRIIKTYIDRTRGAIELTIQRSNADD